MLTVCTTSPDSALAELGDLLTLLGATASSSGHWKALVGGSEWVERYVTNSRSGVLRRQVYLETVAGRGSQRLMLSRVPVLGIGRMFNATDTGDATEYCSTDYRLEDPDAGFLEMRSNAGFGWNSVSDWNIVAAPRPAAVYRPWLICYEAGYQLACASSTASDWISTTTGRTLPEDIERAVLLKAAEFYSGGGVEMESMKVGPLGLNFKEDSVDPIVELLAPYRSV